MKFITNKELKEPTYLIKDGITYRDYSEMHEFEWKIADTTDSLGVYAQLSIRKDGRRKTLAVLDLKTQNTRRYLVGPVDVSTDEAFELIGAVRQ